MVRYINPRFIYLFTYLLTYLLTREKTREKELGRSQTSSKARPFRMFPVISNYVANISLKFIKFRI